MSTLTLFAILLGVSSALASSHLKRLVNPYINQTSDGIYDMYFRGGGKLSLYSTWYQDDLNKRLAITVGRRGTSEWMMSFWFFPGITYEEVPPPKGSTKPHCMKYTDFGYEREVGGYNSTYLSFVNRAKLSEADGEVEVDLFAGQALDGVGPLNVMVAADMAGLYTKMYTIGAIGATAFHYSEYYLTHRNNTLPGDEHFVVPQNCLDHAEIKQWDSIFDSEGKMKAGTTTHGADNASVSLTSIGVTITFAVFTALYHVISN